MLLCQIKDLNKSTGRFFFEPASMRFFNSRVSDQTYEGKGRTFFVTSEKGPNGARLFSVRWCDHESGEINTLGGFQAYASRASAIKAARVAALNSIDPLIPI